MEGKLNFLFAVLAVILIASVALLTYSCSSPALPGYFKRKLAFEDALAAAEQADKPVLALFVIDDKASKSFQAGPLQDSRIAEWVTANTQPAYVDASRAESGNADAAALLQRYEVETFPTLLLLRKGREIARWEGETSARDLLKWLTENASAPTPTPAG
jgi:hypothetical protein